MASDAFTAIKTFLLSDMRMSHIYQPVMLRTLLEHGGSALISEIAASFLSLDQSQREYYEEITKKMPGQGRVGPHLGLLGADARSVMPERRLCKPRCVGVDQRGELPLARLHHSRVATMAVQGLWRSVHGTQG